MKRETIIAALKAKLAEYPDGPTAHAFDAGYMSALRFVLDLLEDDEEMDREEGKGDGSVQAREMAAALLEQTVERR